MRTTLPNTILATFAIAQLTNPQAITILTEPLDEAVTTVCSNEEFTPGYRLSTKDDNGQVVYFATMVTKESGIAKAMLAMGELVEIGSILFKDSRDISAEEAVMMQQYITKKYTEM